jgi:hypothetical protein
MNVKTNFPVFMAIIALTTATQGQLSGRAVSEFNAVKTSLQGQLTEGERAQWKLEEAEAALERDQQSGSELILKIIPQGQQIQQLGEDLREIVRELEANYERRQAKIEQEQATLSELRRVNAVMKEMTERLNITTASDPLQTLKICQEMLPKLDDSFRVYMEYGTNYGDADQIIKVQRWYVANRQQLLDIFNLVQGDINGISGPATVNPLVEEKTSPKVESSRTQGAVTVTLVPMTKEDIDKLRQKKVAEEQAKRKLFEKQEAEREANGDFSQAPGLTPEQREAAEIRWSEKDAAESIKGAKPAPQ